MKKRKILLPLLICFIMVTSILGYMSSTNSEKIKYKGYTFNKIDNGWLTYIGNKKIILINNPNKLEDYEIKYKNTKINLNELNSAQKIYLSINPEDGLFLGNLQNNIFPFLIPRLVISCYEDNEDCTNLPLKDCKDANKEIKVFLIKKEQDSKFYYKDNCLVIQGNQQEITKMIDKLTLELLFDEN